MKQWDCFGLRPRNDIMADKSEILQDLKLTLQHYHQLGVEWVSMKEAGGTLEKIRAELGDCKRCRLCEGRKNIVFGVGNPQAELMFVGEGPGRDEDTQGEPFVGRAGKLLGDIIKAMNMTREEVYINNIVMCRPPENRAPLPDEAALCIPFLLQRIEVIKPKIIVCLGSVATQFLLKTERKISQLRGEWQDLGGIKIMPTYHPAFLLRNPEMKKYVWADMQKVMGELKA